MYFLPLDLALLVYLSNFHFLLLAAMDFFNGPTQKMNIVQNESVGKLTRITLTKKKVQNASSVLSFGFRKRPPC